MRGLGAVAPPPPRKKKKKKEKKRKKETKIKKRKGTMNNVELLHIKCCFIKFFSSPVALKNLGGIDSCLHVALPALVLLSR